MDFKDLGLIEPLLKALEREGYKHPSPIQEQSIGHLLNGRDLLGCAQTGTGKTAAFALPIIQKIALEKSDRHYIHALIVTPTRELACQINENIISYSRFLSIRTCTVFGGVSSRNQIEKLKKGVDIVVATPGRFIDLYRAGFINVKDLSVLVLDEADRMLDMGFINDIKAILRILPKERQNLLFSATMPSGVRTLVDKILHDYITVEVSPELPTVEAIEQRLYYVDAAAKPQLLAELIKKQNMESVLVFTKTKYGADRVARSLKRAGIEADSIHGDKSQNSRQNALKNFKQRKIKALVATDIAARGIDIDGLPYVINYDLPDTPETYIHRIGRTGRAGKSGCAITFAGYNQLLEVADIEKLIGKKIPVVKDHAFKAQTMQLIRPAKPQETKQTTSAATGVRPPWKKHRFGRR